MRLLEVELTRTEVFLGMLTHPQHNLDSSKRLVTIATDDLIVGYLLLWPPKYGAWPELSVERRWSSGKK